MIKYKIALIIIIGVLLIIWLQYPDLKQEEDVYTCRNIFNNTKLPLLVILIIILVYLICDENKMADNIIPDINCNFLLN